MFAAPGRYIQGRGAIDRLGEVLEQLKSEKPLIVRDPIVEEIMGEALGGLPGRRTSSSTASARRGRSTASRKRLARRARTRS